MNKRTVVLNSLVLDLFALCSAELTVVRSACSVMLRERSCTVSTQASCLVVVVDGTERALAVGEYLLKSEAGRVLSCDDV